MPSQSQAQRAYSAAHFVLELGPEHAGFFRSVEGGGVKSEILSYKAGSGHETWRQLARPQFEDIKIQVGMGMADSFYAWIEAFFRGDIVRKSGAIVAGDFHYQERARREFADAIIGGLDIPKLDATDRNACYMTVTLVPETINFSRPRKGKLDSTIGNNRQKLWTSANFDFFIDGFEQACRRVTKIDGFSIQQKVLSYHSGTSLYPIRVPGAIEFPNLTFYMPEADARPLMDHFTTHVIRGQPQKSRMTGQITIKDNIGARLCEIHLMGIDIASITPEKSDATSDEIKQVKVEISVESMKFEYVKVDANMLE